MSEDEQPVEKVFMSAFYIDRFPVKNEDYLLFINDGGYSKEKYWCSNGWLFIKNNGMEHPAY